MASSIEEAPPALTPLLFLSTFVKQTVLWIPGLRIIEHVRQFPETLYRDIEYLSITLLMS